MGNMLGFVQNNDVKNRASNSSRGISPPISSQAHTIQVIQPKLTVGAPNDIYEKEADRLADRILRMPSGGCTGCLQEEMFQTKPLNDEITRLVQRASMDEEETLQRIAPANSAPEVTPGIESNIDAMKSGGQPLSPSTRSFFEPRFGADFSHVRVHAGEHAAQTAQSLHAKAFTVGSNIVFSRGQYSPETEKGKHLLAHELTHAIQQGAAGDRYIPTIQRTWKDYKGNKLVAPRGGNNDTESSLTNYTEPKVWVMHSNDFKTQAEVEFNNAVGRYGERGAAISNPVRVDEFETDLKNIRGENVLSVVMDFHGMNQSLNVIDSDSDPSQQITSTGTGRTNISGSPARNVCDLSRPGGNIRNATLYLNTCHSMDMREEAHDGQGSLKGERKETLGEAFARCFNFSQVRGTAGAVNYVAWYHFFDENESGTPYPEDGQWVWIDRNGRRRTERYLSQRRVELDFPSLGLIDEEGLGVYGP